MTWNFGPERAEAIRALEELIRKARLRLDAIGATADAEETSFHLRDAADIEYGELRRETEAMEDALRTLGEGDPDDDVRVMRDALETLRRDIER
jgi:hypothetical protein